MLWRVALPRKKEVRPGMWEERQICEHLPLVAGVKLESFIKVSKFLFATSNVLPSILSFKFGEIAKLRQPPHSFSLFQVHVEQLISIKFICELAIGAIHLVNICAISAIPEQEGMNGKVEYRGRGKALLYKSTRNYSIVQVTLAWSAISPHFCVMYFRVSKCNLLTWPPNNFHVHILSSHDNVYHESLGCYVLFLVESWYIVRIQSYLLNKNK